MYLLVWPTGISWQSWPVCPSGADAQSMSHPGASVAGGLWKNRSFISLFPHLSHFHQISSPLGPFIVGYQWLHCRERLSLPVSSFLLCYIHLFRFFRFHIYVITYSLCLSLSDISLSITPSKFIHIVANDKTSCLSNIPLCVCASSLSNKILGALSFHLMLKQALRVQKKKKRQVITPFYRWENFQWEKKLYCHRPWSLIGAKVRFKLKFIFLPCTTFWASRLECGCNLNIMGL